MGIELSNRPSIDNNFGVTVKLTDMHKPRIWPDHEITPWLKENCIGKWKYCISTIWFEYESDAVAYKLRWM